ncbi:hypothetical protein PITC_093070 [Penicillium italicum]|uniref:Uncharacterized protein n=1 Tax=Penicillium italicum TaxID=40296 RepID=A0A0A2LLH9_PENIT|nr:hypothetical protein PITC_093070 [Penicillium italicum]
MRLKSSAICLTASCGSLCSATNDILKHESVGLLTEPLQLLPLNLSQYTIPANYGAPAHNLNYPVQPGVSVVIVCIRIGTGRVITYLGRRLAIRLHDGLVGRYLI